jgi:hypothetical protein
MRATEYVPLTAIGCKNKPLRLQWVVRGGWTKKEKRKKGKINK